MFIGTLYILGACLCWSAVFVVPDMLSGFSSPEISLGRFFFFGLLSAAALLSRKKYLLGFPYRSIWKHAFLFGFASTIGSYTATVFCIRYANSSTAVLLFGAVPIIVALYGNLRKREFPFSIFRIPCTATGVGILLANLEIFHTKGIPFLSFLWGVLWGLAAVGLWIWYVIGCFDFMKKHSELHSTDWVVMVGAAVFVQVLAIGVFFCCFGTPGVYFRLDREWAAFFGGTLLLGVVSSWLSLYCWTQGNARLPISFVGQIAVFELIFGFALIFLVEQKIPGIAEVLGMVLPAVGVLHGLRSLNRLSMKDRT